MAGASYDLTDSVELDFRLYNDGMALGEATILLLGLNSRY